VRPGGWLSLVWLAAVATLLARTVKAAGPLGAQGSTIQTSSYSIDLFQGPVLAGSRPTAMGGAFAGLGEGVDGDPVNAASPAMRVRWSFDWFDYDLTAGITAPGTLRKTDFDNNGQTGFSYQKFYFATLGANLQFGPWGFGAVADGQMYNLEGLPAVAGAPPHLNVLLARGHLLGSRAFFRGQWMIGAGARFALLSLTASDQPNGTGSSQALFSMSGAAPEAGVVWAPHFLPLRVGLSARAAVSSQPEPANQAVPDAQGDIRVGVMLLPSNAELPWEVEGGVALQIGRRPLNIPWLDPHDLVAPVQAELVRSRAERTRAGVSRPEEARQRKAEEQRLTALRREVRNLLRARYRTFARQKVLVSASVLVSGPVRSAVGVESFLQQVVDRSGQRASVTPRLGVETEPIEGWLQVRAGSYLEPTRYREGSARIHATLGFDLRLLLWSVFGLFDADACWRVGGAIDGARNYFGWGATVGLWH